ncbi:alpha/beta hydrolase [Actinomadura oligospora]|uniref:alpha/beta hydrolase n=1 Tax=Actinomadura oligospora TaxID=111804 RepID=UPI0004B0BC63|nr:alpha/beta hydrolase [Actinomadura oligospora]
MRIIGRRSAAAVAVLAVAGSTAAAGRVPDPYAAPGPLPVLSAGTLSARYAAVHDEIETAHATAQRTHDGGREQALAGFLSPGRAFLSFDARGSGRAVEVTGDLAHADRVAIVVPGADGRLTNFDSWKWAGGGARSLADQARREAPGTRLAVIAWLGYASPSTLSTGVLTDDGARTAATALRTLVTDVHRLNGRAGMALLCHSYGSVVCGRAGEAGPLPVDEVALFGSPGTTANSARRIFPSARVWAGRSSGDWMRFVPHVRLLGIGFGRDPLSSAFGARRFAAGGGPHSAYLKPGSTPLANLTRIALRREAEVTRG